MSVWTAIDAMAAALFVERAKTNVAKLGAQDLETLALALAEECGEVAKAVLESRAERSLGIAAGPLHERIREEAIDTGALCVQILRLLNCPPAPGDALAPDGTIDADFDLESAVHEDFAEYCRGCARGVRVPMPFAEYRRQWIAGWTARSDAEPHGKAHDSQG